MTSGGYASAVRALGTTARAPAVDEPARVRAGKAPPEERAEHAPTIRKTLGLAGAGACVFVAAEAATPRARRTAQPGSARRAAELPAQAAGQALQTRKAARVVIARATERLLRECRRHLELGTARPALAARAEHEREHGRAPDQEALPHAVQPRGLRTLSMAGLLLHPTASVCLRAWARATSRRPVRRACAPPSPRTLDRESAPASAPRARALESTRPAE